MCELNKRLRKRRRSGIRWRRGDMERAGGIKGEEEGKWGDVGSVKEQEDREGRDGKG